MIRRNRVNLNGNNVTHVWLAAKCGKLFIIRLWILTCELGKVMVQSPRADNNVINENDSRKFPYNLKVQGR